MCPVGAYSVISLLLDHQAVLRRRMADDCRERERERREREREHDRQRAEDRLLREREMADMQLFRRLRLPFAMHSE